MDFEKGKKLVYSSDIIDRIDRFEKIFTRRLESEPFQDLDGAASAYWINVHAAFLSAAFVDKDRDEASKLLEVLVKIVILRIHILPVPSSSFISTPSSVYYPLVLGDDKYIEWHAQFVLPFVLSEYVGRAKQWNEPFSYYQISLLLRLALLGEDDLIGEMCNRAFKCEETVKKKRLYIHDYKFYAALIAKDEKGVAEQLELMCSPKFLKYRSDDDSQWSREQYFFHGWATLYAKVAEYRGLAIPDGIVPPIFNELSLSTENAFLENFEFLKNFDIFSPFMGISDYCDDPSALSPGPKFDLEYARSYFWKGLE
ncbi:hypothetical protein [Agaribacterium haliotis]|uniref:hypothetical protein n=1 Tax=Agaribacterium haliotis TaxID=2013869 RepID=UPI000BB5498A|nr:hypothetical protein [Agaribacterium haliotis]